MKRPNIVMVQSDSMDGRAMGCMGHPAMGRATPHMDELAHQGVLFENAYSNNPICCPSRAGMWSGVYSHRCEAWNNYKGLEPGAETFGTLLERAGYSMGVFGKTDYLSGGHTVRARVSPWTSTAGIMRPNYNMQPPEILENREQRVHPGDWKNTDRAVDWLRGTSAGDRPFFLYLGLNVPHPQFVTSHEYLDRVDLDRIGLPPCDPTDHPVTAYQRVNKNWTHGLDDETVLKVRSIYYAMIAETNALLGRVLDALRELDISGNTYVIYTSDHGELNMEHGQFYKMSMYEPSVRVPMLIRGPGIAPGTRQSSLCSLVDIFPTLCGMAELPVPRGLDGRSLLEDPEGGNLVYSEHFDSSANAKQFMVRRDSYKYIAYPGYPPMLFDLAHDPWEIDNLAPRMPEKAAEMDGLLRSVVDYPAVNRRVIDYDKRSFAAWRKERLEAGDYRELMGRVFSGWDIDENYVFFPWTDENERQILSWLGDYAES